MAILERMHRLSRCLHVPVHTGTPPSSPPPRMGLQLAVMPRVPWGLVHGPSLGPQDSFLAPWLNGSENALCKSRPQRFYKCLIFLPPASMPPLARQWAQICSWLRHLSLQRPPHGRDKLVPRRSAPPREPRHQLPGDLLAARPPRHGALSHVPLVTKMPLHKSSC